MHILKQTSFVDPSSGDEIGAGASGGEVAMGDKAEAELSLERVRIQETHISQSWDALLNQTRQDAAGFIRESLERM